MYGKVFEFTHDGITVKLEPLAYYQWAAIVLPKARAMGAEDATLHAAATAAHLCLMDVVGVQNVTYRVVDALGSSRRVVEESVIRDLPYPVHVKLLGWIMEIHEGSDDDKKKS